jgi:hypothetical protein
MTTTIHLPDGLLSQVDRRAGDLGISRNLYIRRALERAVDDTSRWSRRFQMMLRDAEADKAGQEAVDEMMRAIRNRRTRKAPRDL